MPAHPVRALRSTREAFLEAHPDFPILDAQGGVEGSHRFLLDRGWLNTDESVSAVTVVIDGDEWLVLRVETRERWLLVEQARPWCRDDGALRVAAAARFCRCAATIAGVGDRMPKFLASDEETQALCFEERERTVSLWSLYTREDLHAEEARQLGSYLRSLHAAARALTESCTIDPRLRRADHRSLFEEPLCAVGGPDLDAMEPGFAAAVAELRSDGPFCQKLQALGDRYLETGDCLVHGDFSPRYWLRGSTVRVLGGKHAFFGDAELDIGIAVAHLVLSRQYFGIDQELIAAAVDPSPEVVVQEALVAQYAAVEIVRCLAGSEQLPLPPTDGFRANMLRRARVAMLEESLEVLQTWV